MGSSVLEVSGPFEVTCDGSGRQRRVRHAHGTTFWKQPAVAAFGSKHGVYVFAIRAAKGHRPWYVGRATKGFRQETFTKHKCGKYSSALSKRAKGTPVLFFVCAPASKNKVPKGAIREMERELTQDALLANPDLTNVQNTKNLPKWAIKGLVRSPRGKPTKAATAFGKMLRLK